MQEFPNFADEDTTSLYFGPKLQETSIRLIANATASKIRTFAQEHGILRQLYDSDQAFVADGGQDEHNIPEPLATAFPTPANATAAAVATYKHNKEENEAYRRKVSRLREAITSRMTQEFRDLHGEDAIPLSTRPIAYFYSYLRGLGALTMDERDEKIREVEQFIMHEQDRFATIAAFLLPRFRRLESAGSAISSQDQMRLLRNTVRNIEPFKVALRHYEATRTAAQPATLDTLVLCLKEEDDRRHRAPTTGSLYPQPSAAHAPQQVNAVAARDYKALYEEQLRLSRNASNGAGDGYGLPPPHYCWTHGPSMHTSSECEDRNVGHQPTATLTNKMGGATRRSRSKRSNTAFLARTKNN
jgi:hypothetical protein